MWLKVKVDRKSCRLATIVFLLTTLGSCVSEPAVEHVWVDRDQEKNSSLLHVQNVVSGDTIILEDGRTVKYLGIQAPKKGEPFFEKSRQANEFLLKSGKVFLQYDRVKKNSQGQVLAYVQTPRLGVYCFVNMELLEYGYVKISKFPAKHEYLSAYHKLEEEAKQEKKGLWGAAYIQNKY